MTDLIAFWYAKDYLKDKIKILQCKYKKLNYSEFGTIQPLRIKQDIEIYKHELSYINERIKEIEAERKHYNEWSENNVDAKTGEITYFKKEEM